MQGDAIAVLAGLSLVLNPEDLDQIKRFVQRKRVQGLPEACG